MTTAGSYPKTLVVIRDCHAKNNLVVTARTADDEQTYRKIASKRGWKVAERKAKAAKEPTCGNCASMEVRQTRDGENHRWCDMHGALKGAFNLTLTQTKGKGGAL